MPLSAEAQCRSVKTFVTDTLAFNNPALSDEELSGSQASNKSTGGLNKTKSSNVFVLSPEVSVAKSSQQLVYEWAVIHPSPSHDASTGSPRMPCSRTEHAACIHHGCVYMHGGRDGRLPLKDFWRFIIEQRKWESLDCDSKIWERPGHLEGHTLVSDSEGGDSSPGDYASGCLYAFGGERGYCSSSETPLWTYDVGHRQWTKGGAQDGSEVLLPAGRRGHSAVLHSAAMHVYGGYIDLRGSSSELWTYDFASKMWHMAYTSDRSRGGCGGGRGGPPGRHNHSAVVHGDSMFVYGGMTDLEPRDDLWRWSFNVRCWTKLKSSLSKSQISRSRLVFQVNDCMAVFEGDGNGVSTMGLWQLKTASGLYQRCEPALCQSQRVAPPAMSHYAMAVVPHPLPFPMRMAARNDACTRSLPLLDAARGQSSAEEAAPVAKLQRRPHTSPSIAGTGQLADDAHRRFRNQITPKQPELNKSRMSPNLPKSVSRGFRTRRVAFQSDYSLFCPAQQSLEHLVTGSCDSCEDLPGLDNPAYGWSAGMTLEATANEVTGWPGSAGEANLKRALSSDYSDLYIVSRLSLSNETCNVPGVVRSGSLSELNEAAATVKNHITGTLIPLGLGHLMLPAGVLGHLAMSCDGQECRAIDASEARLCVEDAWTDAGDMLLLAADGSKSSVQNDISQPSYSQTADMEAEGSYDVYIIGGRNVHSLSGSTAMTMRHQFVETPLTMWRCRVTAKESKRSPVTR